MDCCIRAKGPLRLRLVYRLAPPPDVSVAAKEIRPTAFESPLGNTIMLRLQRDRLASRNVPLDRPTVVAFRPIGATGRPSFRPLGMARASHSTAEAHIIPLQPRRLASPARSAARPTSPVMGKYTRTDAGHPRESATGEDDDRQRMLENLVVFAWIGTLMTVAFYVFSKLLGI